MPCEMLRSLMACLCAFKTPFVRSGRLDLYTTNGSFYTARDVFGIVTAAILQGDRMVWVLLGAKQSCSADTW